MTATATAAQPDVIELRHVLPDEGFVRLRQIIGGRRQIRRGEQVTHVIESGVLPISKSAWLRGVAAGRYPRGVRHGSATLYRVEDIRALLATIGGK